MTRPHQLSESAISALHSWFDDKGIVTPSINYAVFDRHGILFHHGIGEFQRDGRTPRVDTIYRIASMTKSFCIAAVLTLVDAGRVGLDEEVSRYLPEFPGFTDAFGVKSSVTVRMLMTNSSGMPEDNAWTDYHLGLTRDELRAIVERGVGFSDIPGAGYQYSNLGFGLLGLIVENVTGELFADYATRTLIEPLGLTSTRFDVEEYPERGEGGSGIAYGYQSFDDGATWIDRAFVPSGALDCAGSAYSTLVDIAAWSGWLSSAFDAANGDDTILTRASRRLMQRIWTPIPSIDSRLKRPDLENIGYGMGLTCEMDGRFGAIAQHSGGLPGFSTNMRWHLASGLGVTIFTNTNGLSPAFWAADLLRIALEDVDAPAKQIALWPATFAAAEAVEAAVLSSGRVEDLGALLSPNVLSDVPADLRADRLATAIACVGGLTATADLPPLAERMSWATSAAQLCWRIPGTTGALNLKLEMTGTIPSLLQRLDIEVEDAAAAVSLVSHHYVPTVPATAADSAA